MNAERAKAVGVVDRDRGRIAITQHAEVLAHRRHGAGEREDAIAQHERRAPAGSTAPQAAPQFPLQIVGVAMMKPRDGLAQQLGCLNEAIMGRLVGQHHVAARGDGLDRDVAGDVAGGKIERPGRVEELGGQPLDGQRDRVSTEAAAAGGRMDSKLPRGFTGRLDHLRSAGQPEVAGAAEIEVSLAVDERFGPRRSLHDRQRSRVEHLVIRTGFLPHAGYYASPSLEREVACAAELSADLVNRKRHGKRQTFACGFANSLTPRNISGKMRFSAMFARHVCNSPVLDKGAHR